MEAESLFMAHEESVPVAEIFDRNIFEKNIKAISVRDSATGNKLVSHGLPAEFVRMTVNKDGTPSMLFKGRQLMSRFDPEREATQVATAALKEGYALILGFGLGFGYHIPAILEAEKTSSFILYEPDPDLLVAALGIVNLSDYLSDPKLQIVTDLNQMFFSTPYGDQLIPAISEAALPGYRGTFAEEYEEFVERIRDIVRNSDILVSTVLTRDGVWYDYMVENFSRYCDLSSIGRLKDKFTGVPAVIVAAGPSLDRNYKLLKKAKGKALILSVGTAIGKFAELDIAPDITLVLESNDIMYQFKDARNMDQGYFALTPNSFDKLFDLPFKGKFCFTGHHEENVFVMDQLNKKDSVIAAGGSVATAAFSVAALAGCDPIIMIGQDLAFGEGGRFHAENTGCAKDNPFNKIKDKSKAVTEKELKEMSMLKVEGYYGGEVLTQANLRNYLLWFERNIPILQQVGREVINSTQGGAKIHGALQLSFEDAVEKYMQSEYPIMDILDEAAVLDPVDRNITGEKFRGLMRKAKHLRGLVAKELDLVEQTFNLLKKIAPDENKTSKKVSEINRLEKKIKRAIKELDPMISPLINQQSLIATKCFDYDGLDELSALRQNMRQSHVLYKGMSAACDKVVASLESIYSNLDTDQN